MLDRIVKGACPAAQTRGPCGFRAVACVTHVAAAT